MSFKSTAAGRRRLNAALGTMKDESEGPRQSRLATGAKASAVSGIVEIALILAGTVILGAAYTSGIHILALLVVFPIAFYVFRKWIVGA
jgi:hypothetical protein